MSVSGQLKGVLIPIIEEWWSNRQLGTVPIANDYDRLGNAIANLLELPNLPVDLREALQNHLTGMFGDKRILAPEWCRRLYSPLAELHASSQNLEHNRSVELDNPENVTIENQFSAQKDEQTISQTINGEASETTFQEAPSY